MDVEKIYDLKWSINSLRKEIKLIKEYLDKCYLNPESIYISFEKAQEYFAIFVLDKKIAKKLKKNKNNLVIFSEVLSLIEEGFKFIEDYRGNYSLPSRKIKSAK